MVRANTRLLPVLGTIFLAIVLLPAAASGQGRHSGGGGGGTDNATLALVVGGGAVLALGGILGLIFTDASRNAPGERRPKRHRPASSPVQQTRPGQRPAKPHSRKPGKKEVRRRERQARKRQRSKRR